MEIYQADMKLDTIWLGAFSWGMAWVHICKGGIGVCTVGYAISWMVGGVVYFVVQGGAIFQGVNTVFFRGRGLMYIFQRVCVWIRCNVVYFGQLRHIAYIM